MLTGAKLNSRIQLRLANSFFAASVFLKKPMPQSIGAGFFCGVKPARPGDSKFAPQINGLCERAGRAGFSFIRVLKGRKQ